MAEQDRAPTNTHEETNETSAPTIGDDPERPARTSTARMVAMVITGCIAALAAVTLGAIAVGDGLQFSPWLIGFFPALALLLAVLHRIARRAPLPD